MKSFIQKKSNRFEGISELEFIFNSFKLGSSDSTVLKFDFSLARGLSYYSGMIVEVDAPRKTNMVPLEEEEDMMI